MSNPQQRSVCISHISIENFKAFGQSVDLGSLLHLKHGHKEQNNVFFSADR